MAKPRVFVSSTFLDNEHLRKDVIDFLEDLHCEVKAFERAGVFFDPKTALDESCYREIVDTDLVVLLIGSRYGNPTSKSTAAGNRPYVSVTRQEYIAARDNGIPIYTFVKDTVLNEFKTYRQNPNLKPAHVDNTQIFDLVGDIYKEKRNNLIEGFHTSDEITGQLTHHFSGMISDFLRSSREHLRSDKRVRINPYKLYFYRTAANTSAARLSDQTGIKRGFLEKLEKAGIDAIKPPDASKFRGCNLAELDDIEKHLKCKGQLRAGMPDDFHSEFVHFYVQNRGKHRRSKKVATGSGSLLFPAKVAVFDFDGTLTRKEISSRTTWERIWTRLGYKIEDCTDLHIRFSRKEYPMVNGAT